MEQKIQERIATAENAAGEYFKQGLNCAECVFQIGRAHV